MVKRAQPYSDDDYRPRWDEPFEEIATELREVSKRLQKLLPDPSIGPEERIERLARVIPCSILMTRNRLSARTKLLAIRYRLTELVPDEVASGSLNKVDYLKSRLDEIVPGEERTIVKLEKLGDFRAADIGVSPRHWE